ncbi:MAG TPA: hypothetical protein DEQ87_13710 [Algoriphagus sp.]|jgi:hypothetical protein|uniref:hypothetical protein n=2 Tax=Algoriphagus TaxID=246875 RepID=UPI000C3CFCC0|nr:MULTISPECIES: hypothetical protein [unclassified Algoriphagus]MAL15094.1 hypothetical protein [Algoriphagus sp.]MAN87856.1 hypothetical protein [Algoriphagus sp.]HAD52323.1 hypothetical protein [Algoriphagus sp.]HAZ24717.1 hypothetical protein [Algoriphagus sp.]HCB46600.1 hypothetical protein [Algoriphagus sp.]|tara:strand:+ start:3060 stop:3578 length:519 start_codon:yes stop_codon:yes gene_type:complete
MCEDLEFFGHDFEIESEKQKQRRLHLDRQYEKYSRLGIKGIKGITPIWATDDLIFQNMMNSPSPWNNLIHVKVSTNDLVKLIDFGELNPSTLFSNDRASNMRFVTTLDLWEKAQPVDPPTVSPENVNGEFRIGISDGRHRTILAYHIGADCIPICFNKYHEKTILALVRQCN